MATAPDLWDKSKRRAWDRALWFADTLAKDPGLQGEAASWIERHWGGDPSAGAGLVRWRSLLAGDGRAIREKLMAEDDDGEFLRDTIPPLRPIPADERARMLRRAR